MKTQQLIPAMLLMAISIGVWTETCPAGIYNPAELIVPYESSGANPENPHFWVRQRLPVGDTMTATLTTDGGETIKNADDTIPTWQGTMRQGEDGVSFIVPGIVNGKVVKDIHQTHSNPSVANGTLEVAAFANGRNGQPEALPLGGWLADAGYVGDAWLGVPDFRAVGGPDIYYSVDIVSWNDVGITDSSTLEAMFGTTFDVVDGACASWPGILFGTSPNMHDARAWAQSDPYTGTVVLDSLHDFGTPEPATLLLAASGGVVLLRHRRRAR